MPSNRPKQYDIADGSCLPQLSALCHLIVLHNWRQRKNEIARGAYVSQCVLKIFEKPFLSGISPNP